jgi:hypothetical protein
MSKSATVVHDLLLALGKTRHFIADMLERQNITSETGELKRPMELQKELSEDSTLHDAQVLDIEKMNSAHFAKVVDAVMSLKTSFAACSRDFTDATAQKSAYDKLAKDSAVVNMFVVKQLKWSGSAKTVGETKLLKTGEQNAKLARVLLEKFGMAEIASKVEVCRVAVVELELVAGGMKDGTPWCRDLADTAPKDVILQSFDASLKDANDGNVITIALETLVKASS